MLKLSGKCTSDEHLPFPVMLDKWGVTVIGANWVAQRVSAKDIKEGKGVCWCHEGDFLEYLWNFIQLVLHKCSEYWMDPVGHSGNK